MTIGEKIHTLRKSNGWSQEELADRIGVTRQAISRWESDSAKPEADKIIELCDLFEVTADYLLRDIAPIPPPVQPLSAPAPTFTPLRFLGALLSGSGLTLLVVLVILGQAHDPLVWLNGACFDGFWGYLFMYDLWGLLVADLIAICIGLLLLFPKPVKRLYSQLRNSA